MNTRILAILLLLIPFFGFSQESPKVFRHKVNVGQFSKLRVTDNVNVVYRCVPDSTGMAIYDATEKFSDAFIFSVTGDQLRIQVNTEVVDAPSLPTVYVYSDFLTYVENASNSATIVENPSPTAEFKAVLVGNGVLSVDGLKSNNVKGIINTGNGSLILAGECRKASLVLIGVGTIQADRLKANNVACRYTGSGSIGCWAANTLKTRGIGSTKIYLKGNPTIKKHGPAKITTLPDNSEYAR